MVEDGLIQDVIAHSCLRPETARRVNRLVADADNAGAQYIIVTCSSIGEAVEAAAENCGVPVLRVDRPMADRAVATGRKIGVIATLATTLQPTAELVRRCAEKAGRQIDLVESLCEGAFEALMKGDTATHDKMVRTSLDQLTSEVDVILLAQASMARVVEAMPQQLKSVPILASPTVAMDYLATIL